MTHLLIMLTNNPTYASAAQLPFPFSNTPDNYEKPCNKYYQKTCEETVPLQLPTCPCTFSRFQMNNLLEDLMWSHQVLRKKVNLS